MTASATAIAERVLRGNWLEGERDGTRFAYTRPSPSSYPWQWYWDSGFAAIVWRRFEPARARAEQSRYRYEQTVLTALREVEDALVGVRSSRNQVAARQTQVDALRRALRLAELRYELGASSYLELLDAQRSLFGAELSFAQVLGQQAGAAVTLYKALGGEWPATAPDSVPPR